MLWLGLGGVVFGLWSFITGKKDRKEMETREYYADYPGLKRINRAMINRKVYGGLILIIMGIIMIIKYI